MRDLDPHSTALVLIDLQNGVIALPLAPRSGLECLNAGKSLAGQFRQAGATVILVNVTFARDYADAPPGNVDNPITRHASGLPEGWSDLAEGLQQPGDLTITKRQWGAFFGTDLDLQLRRRGIKTVVLAGIATNFGVESTAREAWERGYDLRIVEDGCATHTQDLHDLAIRQIFPRISRVVRRDDIRFAARS